MMEKQLLLNAVDSLTRYMREHGENLNPEEVRDIQNLLNSLDRIIESLLNGKSFSMENQLNTANYINGLLRKNAPGYGSTK